jgi:hypothetical protein
MNSTRMFLKWGNYVQYNMFQPLPQDINFYIFNIMAKYKHEKRTISGIICKHYNTTGLSKPPILSSRSVTAPQLI